MYLSDSCSFVLVFISYMSIAPLHLSSLSQTVEEDKKDGFYRDSIKSFSSLLCADSTEEGWILSVCVSVCWSTGWDGLYCSVSGQSNWWKFQLFSPSKAVNHSHASRHNHQNPLFLLVWGSSFFPSLEHFGMMYVCLVSHSYVKAGDVLHYCTE